MQVTFMFEGNMVAEDLASKGQMASDRVQSTVRSVGQDAYMRVKDAASHAPGPQVITGEYVDSIQYEYVSDGASGIVRIWSDSDYSDRLEYGFSGTDSMGRAAFSAPFPHFRPAFEAIEPEFEAAMERVADF